jgi:hypothetical protein
MSFTIDAMRLHLLAQTTWTKQARDSRGVARCCIGPGQLSTSVTRREAHLLLGLGLSPLIHLSHPLKARASLVQFPANSFSNAYWLVRAGESEAHARGHVLANPVAKTSMSNALSRDGAAQVTGPLYRALQDAGACGEGCLMWASMTQNAYQTAEILAESFGVGRSRIVPEFSKLDHRWGL